MGQALQPNLNRSFPKIFALGTTHVAKIFEHEVEVTEKIDGSQFVFGLQHDTVFYRSKGSDLVQKPDQMFRKAIQYVREIATDILYKNGQSIALYCEYVPEPKAVTLQYERVPTNHLVLFGAQVLCVENTVAMLPYHILQTYAEKFHIDIAPLIFQGKTTAEEVVESVNKAAPSYLGGPSEGVVIKAYTPWYWAAADKEYDVLAAKFVRAVFQEQHRLEWKRNHTAKGGWDGYKESFRTEARWRKAVQHLREAGTLEQDPRDIGNLIKEVQRDIAEECQEDVKNALWKIFGKELLREAPKGLPEWYKTRLALNDL